MSDEAKQLAPDNLWEASLSSSILIILRQVGQNRGSNKSETLEQVAVSKENKQISVSFSELFLLFTYQLGSFTINGSQATFSIDVRLSLSGTEGHFFSMSPSFEEVLIFPHNIFNIIYPDWRALFPYFTLAKSLLVILITMIDGNDKVPRNTWTLGP